MHEAILKPFVDNIFLIILNIVVLSVLTIFFVRKFKFIGFISSLILFFISFYFIGDIKLFMLYILLPSLIFILIGISVNGSKKKKIRDERYRVEFLTDKGKNIYIPDVNTGIAIFGASGAGKSASAIYQLFIHYAKYNFSGIIYDYKDFELTEIAYPLFRNNDVNFHVLCLHDVNRSIRINPIDPKYIQTESDINSIVSTLVLNLSQSEADSGAGQFFRDGSESLISAVIWRLKTDYPEKCNLPFVVAFLLSAENHHEKILDEKGNTLLVNPYKKLIDWICEDKRAEILGSVFLSAASNIETVSNLYATLASSLRLIASPESFYILGKNDIGLDLNSAKNKSIVSIVNQPSTKEKAITPILATLVDCFLTHMSERNREPSFAVIDEAPTIKIMSLARRIATLRSFGMAFNYCAQDKVQLTEQFSGKEYKMKAILTNLSTIFMGKVNDPDTAKFYERYFELIEKEQQSVSKSDMLSSDKGGTRITTSQKEQSKFRANEFFRLEAGEFIMMSGGVDKKFRFFYNENMEKTKPYPIREVTPLELEMNYLKMLEEAGNFLK